VTYNLHNTALPEEEARDLPTHVKMCAIRHAQTIDEVRKTADEVKRVLEEHRDEVKKELGDFKVISNNRQTRNERAAVAAFLIIATSLWPQMVEVFSPIARALIPIARAFGLP
jgi:hypothetical protein